jgi:hypothetical protein
MGQTLRRLSFVPARRGLCARGGRSLLLRVFISRVAQDHWIYFFVGRKEGIP